MTASQLTEVRLLSTLGKLYGRVHHVLLDTKTTAEAMRWLLSQFPDARQFFSTAHEKGMQFAVFRGRGEHRENIGLEQMHEPAGDCITFAPVHVGAKNGGLLNVVLGVALLAVAYFVPVTATYLVPTAIGLIAGGVIQMLTPQPKLHKNADSSENQSSYVFNGPVNTSAQGNCVPVVYGRCRVGSAVISAGMEAADYAPAAAGVGAGTATGNMKRSPYDA